jgi:CMP-N-acetylneuraminic acid synthetase
MLDGRRVLAVVPARGGSKGIPLKNLRTVKGRSLIARVAEVIRDVPEIDRAVISTDHAGIAAAAEEVGLSVPFLRPEALARDFVGDVDVLKHALLTTEDIDNKRYDVVVMLQPTSPLRMAGEVSATIHKLVDEGWDSVWTLSLTDSKAHPLKQLTIKDGELDYYHPEGANVIARQQMQPVYHRNGAAYALTRSCLLEQNALKGKRAGALVTAGEHVSIDTELDIEFVEFFLNRRKVR